MMISLDYLLFAIILLKPLHSSPTQSTTEVEPTMSSHSWSDNGVLWVGELWRAFKRMIAKRR